MTVLKWKPYSGPLHQFLAEKGQDPYTLLLLASDEHRKVNGGLSANVLVQRVVHMSTVGDMSMDARVIGYDDTTLRVPKDIATNTPDPQVFWGEDFRFHIYKDGEVLVSDFGGGRRGRELAEEHLRLLIEQEKKN